MNVYQYLLKYDKGSKECKEILYYIFSYTLKTYNFEYPKFLDSENNSAFPSVQA